MSTKQKIDEEQKKSYETVKAAYLTETHLFIHVHLRGYDSKGQGCNQDGTFIDQYGAPIDFSESWSEGYRSIEEKLLIHNENCLNKHTYFPLVGGYSGGAHLYKDFHNEEPWNWTGWIPLHRQFRYNSIDGSTHYHNRFFVGLRGNEIQNDMWDYNPLTVTDEEVKGKYLGGYWYEGDVKARYLHINALKTHGHDENAKRYNYIVHPLAYRPLLDILPDCGVDGIQWSVNNIKKEKHFTNDEKNWGNEVHGIELFNDYTYYYSWVRHYGQKHHNGSPTPFDDEYRIFWYDTYPLEYCEFILDNALSKGVYLQTLSANDAFYNRQTSYIDNKEGSADVDDHMEPAEIILRNQVLLSDPKGKYLTETELTHSELMGTNKKLKFPAYNRYDVRLQNDSDDEELSQSNLFLHSRPYGFDTAFGYTALLNTDDTLTKAMFPTETSTNLDVGENIIIGYLLAGQFYSHTGVYDMFDYTNTALTIPYKIPGQDHSHLLWYNHEMKEFDFIFEFPPAKKSMYNEKVLWRYTLEYIDEEKKERVLTTGYFKLNDKTATKVDLQVYQKFKVKWLRFTAFNYENPMRRAWFSPIRGEHFLDTQSNELPLRNCIAITEKTENGQIIIFKDTGNEFVPSSAEKNDKLEYIFERGAEEHLHSYFLQVKPLQQQIDIEAGNDEERYLENVHGYFALSKNYPTQINLSSSWDSNTVLDDKIYFYRVDGQTCELRPLVVRT